MSDKQITSERLYHLDALRAFMLLFGVFEHSSLADRKLGDLELLRFVSDTFRMQCFFMISGFFSALVLDRTGLKAFMGRRLVNLLVPAVLTCLLLNPYAWGWMAAYFKAGEHGQIFLTWHLHTWFLFVLVIYTLLTPGVLLALRSLQARRVAVLSGSLVAILYVLVASALVALADDRLLKWPNSIFNFTGSSVFIFDSAVRHAPYFFGGVLMYAVPSLYRTFHARSPFVWVASILLLSGLYWLREHRFALGVPYMGAAFAELVVTFAIIISLFGIFERYLRKPGVLSRYVAKSSYTIYIIHYFLVAGFLLLFMGAGLSVVTLWIGVSLASIAIGLAVHFGLVERFAAARFVFNGRWR